MNKPRNNAIVVFDETNMPKQVFMDYYERIFKNKQFIFMGDIPNQPGHCMLYDLLDQRIIGPYHTNDFRECTDDEL